MESQNLSKKQRVLFICHHSPVHPFSGAGYRALGILKYLISHYDVDLLVEAPPINWKTSFIDRTAFRSVVEIPPNDGPWRKVAALFHVLPYHVYLHSHQSVRKATADLIAASAPDIIWLNRTFQFPCVPEHHGKMLIVDQYASEPDAWTNLIQNDPRWWAKLFFRFNFLKVMRFERRAYKKISGAICITARDQTITNQIFPSTPTVVVPQGVDTDYYRADLSVEQDSKTLIFSGTDAVRNVEAIRWFCDNVMPTVLNSAPDARLLWVGSVSPEVSQKFAFDWIEFTGFVDHVTEHIVRGAIFVAPFTMGEGMKTKLVEALALGRVVVSTSIGAQGVDASDYDFFRVEDDPKKFASKIIEYMNCGDLSRMQAEARDFSVRYFDWLRVTEPLDILLKR